MSKWRTRWQHWYPVIPLDLDVLPRGIDEFFRPNPRILPPDPPWDPLAVLGVDEVTLSDITRPGEDALTATLLVTTPAGQLDFPIRFTAGHDGTPGRVDVWDGADQRGERLSLWRNSWRLDQNRLVGTTVSTLIAPYLARRRGLTPNPDDTPGGPPNPYTTDRYGDRVLTPFGFQRGVQAAVHDLYRPDRQLHAALAQDFRRREDAALRLLDARNPENQRALRREVPLIEASLRHATRVRRPNGLRAVGLDYSGAQVIPSKAIYGASYLPAAIIGGSIGTGQDLNQGGRYTLVAPGVTAEGISYQLSNWNVTAANNHVPGTAPRLRRRFPIGWVAAPRALLDGSRLAHWPGPHRRPTAVHRSAPQAKRAGLRNIGITRRWAPEFAQNRARS